MATKYYTHFLTGSAQAPAVGPAHEWSGVVELHEPLESTREARQLRSLLAVNFNVDSEDILILHWARLH